MFPTLLHGTQFIKIGYNHSHLFIGRLLFMFRCVRFVKYDFFVFFNCHFICVFLFNGLLKPEYYPISWPDDDDQTICRAMTIIEKKKWNKIFCMDRYDISTKFIFRFVSFVYLWTLTIIYFKWRFNTNLCLIGAISYY